MSSKEVKHKKVSEPESANDGWQVVLVRHVRQGTDLGVIAGQELSNVPHWQSTVYFEDKSDIQPWLDGTSSRDAQPWGVCVRLARQKWILFAGPALNAKMIARIGKMKKLQTILAGYDEGQRRSYFRYYDGGKLQLDFKEAGAPGEPLRNPLSKLPSSAKSSVAKAKTPGAVVLALLRHFDAHAMRMTIQERQEKLRLVSLDDKELTSKTVRELASLSFYALMPKQNRASDRLAEAIEQGDPKKVEQAIKAGADLAHLPESTIGPLTTIVLNKKGKWKQCARKLAKAGATLDGISGDESPMSACCQRLGSLNVRGTDDESTIEAIELLLELGANIDAQSQTRKLPGWTALHRAVKEYKLPIVKYLVSQGATIDIKDDHGRTVLDIARDNAKRYRGEAQQTSRKIVRFLREAKSDKGDTSDLQELVAADTQRREQKQEDAWKRLEELSTQALAQNALTQPDKIKLKKLPNRHQPRDVATLVDQFVKAGFAEIGIYQLGDKRLSCKLVALHRAKDSLDATVVRVKNACFVNVARFHRDGSIQSVSDLDEIGTMSAKATKADKIKVKCEYVPQGSVSDLLRQMGKIPAPRKGVEPTTAEEFVKRFEQAYILEVEEQKRVARRILGL